MPAESLPAGIVQVELFESSIFERRLARDGQSSQDAVTRLSERGIQIADLLDGREVAGG